MIEALACGTPVIARPCGSIPEILRDGVTGFIGSSLEELVSAVENLGAISRQRCRDEFETRFTAEVMAANYERVYDELAGADWKMRRNTVRRSRSLRDAALARYAARHWHPTLRQDRPSTGKAQVHQLFSSAYEADPSDRNLDT